VDGWGWGEAARRGRGEGDCRVCGRKGHEAAGGRDVCLGLGGGYCDEAGGERRSRERGRGVRVLESVDAWAGSGGAEVTARLACSF
jgi:hypothetical protein